MIGTLLFDFMYYHFMRLVSHFCLSSYEFVPLSILICVWLWKDDKLFEFGKGFFKYKKNYLVLLFFFMIANNGIGYYTFFTCMFLAITGISKAMKHRSWKAVFQMIRMVVSNVLFMVIALIPCIIYQIQNGANLTERSLADSELYALKIVQLLIPYKDYGIQKLQEYNQEYYQTFIKTESMTSYLGIMAGIGFLALIIGLMRRREIARRREPLALFVELNVFAVLFATMGGFGGIFANFVTSLVRGTNRISIFIAFMSLSTLGILMTRCMKKQNKYSKIWKPICEVLFCALAIFSLARSDPGECDRSSGAIARRKEFGQPVYRKDRSKCTGKIYDFSAPVSSVSGGRPGESNAGLSFVYWIYVFRAVTVELRWKQRTRGRSLVSADRRNAGETDDRRIEEKKICRNLCGQACL